MSLKSHAIVLSMIAAAALATGCATQQPAPVGTPVQPDAEVLAKIAASADRASLSMQRLAQLRGADRAVKTEEFQVPAGLETRVNMTWSGPVDALAAKLADLTGYTYGGTVGPVPSTPVLVAVSVTNTQAFNILMDAGAQAGSAADIVVSPNTKRISIKYPPVTRSGGYAAK